VLEVEREDREPRVIRNRHYAAVDQTQVEVGESRIDLDCAAEASGEKRHRVLTSGERLEKEARCAHSDPGAKKLVDLDRNRRGDDQLSPQLGHERRGEAVRSVAPVRRRDERTGVGADPQRALTSSRR
jgi:hypothetical protein